MANFQHILFHFSVFYVDCEHAFRGSAITNSNTWDLGVFEIYFVAFVLQYNYTLVHSLSGF